MIDGIDEVYANGVAMFDVYSNGVHVYHKQQTGDAEVVSMTNVTGTAGEHIYTTLIRNNTDFDIVTNVTFISYLGTPFSTSTGVPIAAHATKTVTRSITGLTVGSTNTFSCRPDNIIGTINTYTVAYVYL